MAEESSRKATHDLLDAKGEVVDKMTDATGIRYTDRATDESVDYQTGGKAGEPLTMLAVFGAKTKATNTASGARQARTAGSGDDSDVAAIESFFGNLKPGQWELPSTRAGGPRYNPELLAAAIHQVRGKASEGIEAYAAKIADPEPVKDGKPYAVVALANQKVKAVYSRLKADAAMKAAASAEVDDSDL